MKLRALATSLTAVIAVTACSDNGDDAAAAVDDSLLPSCDVDTIRFADTQVDALEDLARRFDPFREEMESAFGRGIEYYPVPNRNAAALALENDDVDLVLAGSAEYVVLNAMADAEPAAALTRDDYYSVIGVHADSGIESLDDLAGESIAIGDIGSGTRHIAPMRILVEDAGFEDPEEQMEVEYLGETWREGFMQEETEAIGAGARHLEPVFEELGEDNVEIIYEGPPMGHDAFMVNPALGEECAEEIGEALTENEEELLSSIWDTADDTDNEKYLESGIEPVEDSDFDVMREAFLAIGVEDFAEFDEDELEDEIEEQNP